MSFLLACVQTEALDCCRWKESLRKGLFSVEEAARSGARLVLLPEAFFPGYYLRGMMEGEQEWRSFDVCAFFSEKARQLKIHLAAGMVLFTEEGPVNSAVLWGPDGRELLRTVKSNLWHFDEKYVRPGRSFSVADTSLGRIGMMICADGRIPEVARILALRKASLILDLTNLTSTGRDRKTLSNPQLDYMLPVRAAENGLWIAVADKVGLEAGSVLNCGGSRVIGPKGETVAAASSWKEELLFASVDLSARGYALTPRKPESWTRLGQPTGETEAEKQQFRPMLPVDNELFACMVRFSADDPAEYIRKASEFLLRALDQGNRLILLPAVPAEREDETLKALVPLMKADALTALPLSGEKDGGEFILFTSSGVLGRTGRDGPGVLSTPLGRIGGIFGGDGWNPEPIRCLMISGSEIVLWYGEKSPEIPGELLVKFARTRASENRIFVLASFEGKGGPVLMAAPSGALLAEALEEGDQAISAMVRRMESRSKTVVPGTNIVGGRHPEAYGDLFSPPEEAYP